VLDSLPPRVAKHFALSVEQKRKRETKKQTNKNKNHTQHTMRQTETEIIPQLTECALCPPVSPPACWEQSRTPPQGKPERCYRASHGHSGCESFPLHHLAFCGWQKCET